MIRVETGEELSDTTGHVLAVEDLRVKFPSEDGVVDAVRGVSFTLDAGEVLGIVGESGSGKSVTSLAIMGLTPPNAVVTGSVRFRGEELLGLPDRTMATMRGSKIAMIFQDPLSALTPVYTIGDQIAEAITVHQDVGKRAAQREAIELLDLVGIPNPAVGANAFPHEFSGGMRQRVMIAMAIANDPDVLIADEPTTALDVTIQAQILEVLKTAQTETGAAVVMITHDLGVVAGFADRIQVMYAGRAVETGPVDEVYYRTRMPYTIGLLGSIPRLDAEEKRGLAPVEGNPPSLIGLPDACQFAPRCPMADDDCLSGEPELVPVGTGDHTVACIKAAEIERRNLAYDDIYPVPPVYEGELATLPREQRAEVVRLTELMKHFPLTKGIFRRRVGTVRAVDGVSLDIRAGEALGLVGESGCGKTTTLLQILDLVPPMDGTIEVFGQDTRTLRRNAARKAIRRDLQVVFQDPMASLDPRLPVFDILAEPLRAHGYGRPNADPIEDVGAGDEPDEDTKEAVKLDGRKVRLERRVRELLELVGLDPSHINRYPQHFSGGQRQRIGIARALALEPRLLILDEPVSALDVSIQAGVLNLLDNLRARLDLSYLFVAHDLAVVRHVADRVAVMYLGRIVEIGEVDKVYDYPTHPYTQALLSAIPIPDPEKERRRTRIIVTGDLPSPSDVPTGCRFRNRCPKFLTLSEEEQRVCVELDPQLTNVDVDHQSACHYNEVRVVV